MTIFSVQSKACITEFEIGDSNHTKQATRNYRKYVHTHNYKYLNECFAELYYETKNSTLVKNICLANHALALSTFNDNLNLYQKVTTAISVTSIIIKAEPKDQLSLEEIFKHWVKALKKVKILIEKATFDAQAAKEAGLHVTSL
jgi:hypothetical protein